MGFETTNIYSTDNSGVLAYLQDHAVPAYFDKVEADATTASTVNCYVGDTVLLQIKIVTNKAAAVVNTASGTTKNVATSATGKYFCYAHKSKSGLSFSWGASTSTETLPVLVITKDSDGNTAVVCSSSVDSSYLKSSVSAVTAKDPAVINQTIDRVTANVTTVVPFVCGCGAGECRYTPNVVYFPTAQYTTAGEIVVNGARYLSNGYWALKDE